MTTLLTGGGTRSREALDDDVDLARDRVLVTRAQGGDRAAFDDLYVRYYRRLYRFCLRRLHDAHEAEDVAQESFTRAWRALPNFAGDRRFYPWLSVIAAHLCTDVLRRRNRSTPVAEFHQGNVASTEDGGEELMIAAVDSDLVARAFQRLSDRHQRILNLREGSGWSYQRIADHEGVGITAVETLLWRARQALKREFAAIAGAEGRTAGWLGGLVSLATLRRFLHLPVHAARRALNFVHTAPAVAVGSAAAATAMVVAASLNPPASNPTQTPVSTVSGGRVATSAANPGAPATRTGGSGAGSQGGSGSGSVPASGGAASVGSAGGSLPTVPSANPTQTVGGVQGTIGGTTGQLGSGASINVPNNPTSVVPSTSGLPGSVEGSTTGIGSVLGQVGQIGNVGQSPTSVLGPVGTALPAVTNVTTPVAGTTGPVTQGAGSSVGGSLGAVGSTVGGAAGAVASTATTIVSNAASSSSKCGTLGGLLNSSSC